MYGGFAKTIRRSRTQERRYGTFFSPPSSVSKSNSRTSKTGKAYFSRSHSPGSSNYLRKLEDSVRSWAAKTHTQSTSQAVHEERASRRRANESIGRGRKQPNVSSFTAPGIGSESARSRAMPENGRVRSTKGQESMSTSAPNPVGRARDKNDNVTVVVRVRPMLLKEVKRHQLNVIEVAKPNALMITRLADRSNPYLKSGKGARYDYSFDAAFGPESSQQEVWEQTAAPLVDTIMDGTNATIFVYGATGTGKTYTMMGNDESSGLTESHSEDKPLPNSDANDGAKSQAQQGIVALTLKNLFHRIRTNEPSASSKTRTQNDTKLSWTVVVSYLEIYNEHIRDLLSPSSRPLNLRENPALGYVHIANLTEATVTTVPEVMELLRAGNCRRRVEPTSANRVSSRSHAILQVQVTCFRGANNGARSQRSVASPNPVFGVKGTPIKAALLSMIDLAGSERAANSNNRGLRLKEGANINKSLLALANCINALAANGNRARRHRPGLRVKYRDSKLTHILKNSLEGKCRVVMIANLSPAHSYFEESLNTLKYASRARNIRIQPVAQIVDELPPQPHRDVLLQNAGAFGALDSEDDEVSPPRRRATQKSAARTSSTRSRPSGHKRESVRTTRRSAKEADDKIAAVRAAAQAEIQKVKDHYAKMHRTLQREVEGRLARKEAEKEAERSRWEPKVKALQKRVAELERANAELQQRSTRRAAPQKAAANDLAGRAQTKRSTPNRFAPKSHPQSRPTGKDRTESGRKTRLKQAWIVPPPINNSHSSPPKTADRHRTPSRPPQARKKRSVTTAPKSMRRKPKSSTTKSRSSSSKTPSRISFNFRELAAGNLTPPRADDKPSASSYPASAANFFGENFDSFRQKLQSQHLGR